MRKLILILLVFGMAVVAFAGPADTIYNQRGQGVQAFAPNYFQVLTSAVTSFDLSNTLYFEIDSPVDCKMWITPTNDWTTGIEQTIYASTPKGRGKGYGMGFVTYSGCNGAVYSSMKGDWSGQ